MTASQVNLLNLDSVALHEMVAQWGEKPFRARQLQRWLHHEGVGQFAAMTNLAKSFREQLEKKCSIVPPKIIKDHISTDGTRKWLLDMGKDNAIETVFIPEDNRGTLCISSQAGCAVNCKFCSTGYQGFNRNLTLGEIIGQLWLARRDIHNAQTTQYGSALNADALQKRVITNVVMMGMGEPLLNYQPVVSALKLMLDDHGYGLSRRRVTLSTSGVVPMIDRLAQDCPVALAVSLHAPNNRLRDELVPLNRKYPIEELLAACQRYLEYAPRDFITFEYVMLKGINDSDQHVGELIDLLKNIPCKLNLIPFNSFPQSDLSSSSSACIQSFSRELLAAGIVTTVRKTRGDDIDAACGQLAGAVKDRTRIHIRQIPATVVPVDDTHHSFLKFSASRPSASQPSSDDDLNGGAYEN